MRLVGSRGETFLTHLIIQSHTRSTTGRYNEKVGGKGVILPSPPDLISDRQKHRFYRVKWHFKLFRSSLLIFLQSQVFVRRSHARAKHI